MSISNDGYVGLEALRDMGGCLLLDAMRTRLSWLSRWSKRRAPVVELGRSLVQRMRLNCLSVGNTRQDWIRGRLRWFVSQEWQHSDLAKRLERELGGAPAGWVPPEKEPEKHSFAEAVQYGTLDPFEELTTGSRAPGQKVVPIRLSGPVAEFAEC
jgi:hypothetical protein